MYINENHEAPPAEPLGFNGIIADDYFFNGGWAELYRYKFKKYLSGVSRYIQNQKIKNVPYMGDN